MNLSLIYSILLLTVFFGCSQQKDADLKTKWNMIGNQSAEELEYPKLHKCVDLGEAYSAAYLTTKLHLLEVNIQRNLSMVACEMASTIMLSTAKRKNTKAMREKLYNFRTNASAEGIAVMSLDVLDYSVIHLSAYERSNRKFIMRLKKLDDNFDENNIDIVKTAGRFIKQQDPSFQHVDPRAKQTVALMPFLGVNMGAGHSVLSNRYEYLKVCFWSVHQVFPHIVVGVLSQNDVDWLKSSGLPFYDIIYLQNLPKSAALPVGTLNEAKRRLKVEAKSWLNPDQPSWGQFKYLYFTESDQILMLRISRVLFDQIDKYPRRMLLPHRLMPYPESVLTAKTIHDREVNGEWNKNNKEGDWLDMSCCLERQNCITRASWVSIKDREVPIVNVYGLQVPLGNSHFKIEKYRHCVLRDERLEQCP